MVLIKHGYFSECGCQDPGSQTNDCDAYGQCICKVNYGGKLCDRCAPGYHKYPECLGKQTVLL